MRPAPPSVKDRLRWVRRWRGLIAQHADDLDARVPGSARRELLPLLSACRWHERHAERMLLPKRAPGRPVWLAGVRSAQHRAPIGLIRISARADSSLLSLGIDLLQTVVAGNRAMIDLSPRSARAQALLIELARAAWESLLRVPPPWRVGEAFREIDEALQEGDRPDVLLLWASETERAAARLWAQSEGIDLRARPPSQAICLVLGGADPVSASEACWAAAMHRHLGLRVAPRRILVEETLNEPFARELRPRAAAAPPIRCASRDEADRAYALARTALGYGARSASGLVESPVSGPPAFRPLAMLDCPADLELPSDPIGVIPVTSIVSLDEAAGLVAAESEPVSLAVFGGTREQRRSLLALAPPGGIAFDRWPTTLAHPGVSSGLGANEGGPRGVGGVEGLLALTRSVVEVSGGGSGKAGTGSRQPPNGSWIDRLYRAPVGNAQPDLSIRPGKIRSSKPQRAPKRRGSKQRT